MPFSEWWNKILLYFKLLPPERHFYFITGLSLLVILLALARLVEFSKVRRRLQNQIEELDRTAKTLIRRDFELSQVSEQLRLTDEAKTHFVTVAAHQLRTPLSAMKWSLKLLLNGDVGELAPAQKEYVKSAYETNENTIKLVNDLLDVSRIEGGRFEYDFKEGDIAEVIATVVSLFNLAAQNKNIKLIFERPAGVSVVIKFDAEKIQMVLENLIGNAINYTPAGGQVIVGLTDDGDKIKISVADTGIGITDKDLPRLFSKFFRLDNAVKMVPNGTGLGLFISKNIVLRHEGNIDVKSEVGRGSVFTLILPKKEHGAKGSANSELKNL